MTVKNLYPNINPTMLLDFRNSKVLDPRITFTRASTATYVDHTGVWREVANNQPRFYFDSVSGASLGFIVEEQRSNSIRNPRGEGGTSSPTHWSVFASNGLTTTIQGRGIQDGRDYVDLRISGTTTSTFYVQSFDNVAASISAGQSSSGSVWLSLTAGSLTNITTINLTHRFEPATGFGFENVTPTATPQRFTVVSTAPASTTSEYWTFGLSFNSGVAIDVTLRFSWPQLETNAAFVTSPILPPAATLSTSTRAADVAVMSGTNFSSWYNQSSGTTLVEAATLTGVTTTVIPYAISDNTFNNSIYGNFASGTSFRGANIVVSGVAQTNSIATFTGIDPVAGITDALAYTANSIAESCNGATTRSISSGSVPTVDRLYLGSNWSGSGNYLNGYLRKFAYYPEQLTNSQLQQLTK